MNIADIAQIVSAVVAVLSFAGSVIVYRRTLNRERKLDTIKMLSEIRMKYPKVCGLSYKAKKKYIKELEFFATGVNQKIYDVKIVNKMNGSKLIYQYEKYLKKIIKRIRKGKEDTKAYIEYEKMINKLKKYKKYRGSGR